MRAQNAFKRQVYTPNEMYGTETQITTLDHGILFVGRTYNTVTTQQGLVLIKTDSLGNMQWAKRFGPFVTYSYNIVQSPDSSFLLCYINSAVFTDDYKLIKLDAAGNVLLSLDISPSAPNKTISGSQLFAKNNGNYYVLGNLNDSLTSMNYWHLFEIDSIGNVLWSNTYNVGSSKSKGTDIDTCSNGDIILLGNTIYNAGVHMPILTRISPTGNLLWSTLYICNTSGEFFPNALEVGPGDHFIVAGSNYAFAGNAFTMRTDSLGFVIWTFEYGGSVNWRIPQEITSVSPTEIVIVGTTYSTGFFMKIDTSGLILCKRKYPVGITSFSMFSPTTYVMSGHSQSTNLAFILTTDTCGVGCDDQSEITSKTSVDVSTMPIFGSYTLPMMTVPVPYNPLPTNVTFADSCGVLTQADESNSELPSVRVYPVPASSEIHIQSSVEITIVQVFDQSGKEVLAECPYANDFILKTDQFSNGMYLLKLAGEDFQTTEIVIVDHH